MRNKRLIIVFVITIACIVGICFIKKEPKIENQNHESSTTAPSIEKDERTPIPKQYCENGLVESSLNNLSDKAFKKEFRKLPDSYEFKVNREIDNTGWMTKEKLKACQGIWLDAQGKKISLKELRFFGKLDEIDISNAKLVDVNYLPSLKESVTFTNCSFDVDIADVIKICNSAYFLVFRDMHIGSLDCLRKIKKIKASMCFENTEISDVSYLENFTCEDVSHLGLRRNLIQDISVLEKFKDRNLDIYLDYNMISDISVFKKFTKPLSDLSITHNRIMDISPLKNVLDSDTYLKIDENPILDYSPIQSYMDKYYYDPESLGVGHTPDLTNKGVFHFDKPPEFQLFLNDIKVKEEKFVYFGVWEAYNGELETPQPAMNAASFVKKIGGICYYDTKKGVFFVSYQGKNYIFKDYQKRVETNGKAKTMSFEMRHMQGDVPYITIQDMCHVFGLKVTKKYGKPFLFDFDEYDYDIKYIKEMNVSLS